MKSAHRILLLPVVVGALSATLLPATHAAKRPERTPVDASTSLRTTAADPVMQSGPVSEAATGTGTNRVTGPGLFGVRWNPCRPITYRVNARGAYPGSVAHLRRAFQQVSAATGVRFVYKGSTSKVAFRTGPDPRADVTVSWATPGQVPRLRGLVAGLASTTIAGHRDGVQENVRGQIALDRTARLRRGFTTSGPATWGQVYLHEIGHVMGLDHIGQRSQVMYPVVGSTNHRFGAGDLRRLRQVGRSAGCIQSSRRG